MTDRVGRYQNRVAEFARDRDPNVDAAAGADGSVDPSRMDRGMAKSYRDEPPYMGDDGYGRRLTGDPGRMKLGGPPASETAAEDYDDEEDEAKAIAYALMRNRPGDDFGGMVNRMGDAMSNGNPGAERAYGDAFERLQNYMLMQARRLPARPADPRGTDSDVMGIPPRR